MSRKSIDQGLKFRSKALDTIAKVNKGEVREVAWGEKANLQEMVSTADVPVDFIEKTTYEIYQGRENVPLVYTELYETRTNRNFPRKVTVKPMSFASVIFLEKMEKEEIKFGTMNPAEEVVVPIKTYAAGFQVTEDMIEYNELYQVDDEARAMGEAYNKLLNHLHMSPILNRANYTESAGTPAQRKKIMVGKPGELGIAQFVNFDNDLKTTLIKALKILPGGNDFRILCNSSERVYLEDAIEAMVLANSTIPTVVKKIITLEKMITYDGDDLYVGEDHYEYAGVEDDYIFIGYPRRQLRTYMKHDLIVDSGDADLSRLIREQRIGRARLGVLAQLGGRFGWICVKIR